MATSSAPRPVVEVPEGILVNNVRKLSLSQIETVDLLCEGEIEGLVDREYSFIGTAGEVGWTSYTAKLYQPYSSSDGYLRSIFLNETPLLSNTGKLNFQSISCAKNNGDWLGYNGDTFWGEGDSFFLDRRVSVTRPLGERLRQSTFLPDGNLLVDRSKNYKITNKNCIGVAINIKIPTLARTISEGETAGDVVDETVSFSFFFRPTFDPPYHDAFNYWVFAGESSVVGKITNGYIHPFKFLFTEPRFKNPPTKFDYQGNINNTFHSGWEIKIYRKTEDSISSFKKNQTYVDSITEYYADNLRYPTSAMVYLRFRADYFTQIPNRAYDVRMLKVKIPSNYDPILRKYTGIWDGTFATAKAYTNNPAWCFYDLLTNRRYGLGKYIKNIDIDKWSLYEIAQYCDTLVPDGAGGLEPRFTCNLLLANRDEAFKILNDFASIFRAIIYYHQGAIFAVQDSEKEPVVLFTNANVENGDFNYSTSSKRTRHSVAIVAWNDPLNFYKQSLEYVEDVNSIKRYGIKETEIAAFGCTSRGQAVRLGRWVLLSETLEVETINFITGLEGAYLRPGDIFKVHDSNRKLYRYSGRTYKINNDGANTYVILDDLITLNASTNYYISLLTPTGNISPTEVVGMTSDKSDLIRQPFIQKKSFAGSAATTENGRTKIALTTAFDSSGYDLRNDCVWMIELVTETTNYFDIASHATENYDYYRVIKIEESEEGKYNIVGLQYAEQKFSEIENGLAFDRTEVTLTTVPQVPENLFLFSEDIT